MRIFPAMPLQTIASLSGSHFAPKLAGLVLLVTRRTMTSIIRSRNTRYIHKERYGSSCNLVEESGEPCTNGLTRSFFRSLLAILARARGTPLACHKHHVMCVIYV